MVSADRDFLRLTHMDAGVQFYHPNDERLFFEWLNQIPCVDRCLGQETLGLVVYLKSAPEEDDLLQLLALCQRYGVAMRQLSKFMTQQNQGWFHDPNKYWYESVFSEP